MSLRFVVASGMQVRLRKKHPCGSDTWTISRTGADVGLVCAGCGRRILLDREEFERRVRTIVQSSASPESLTEESDE